MSNKLKQDAVHNVLHTILHDLDTPVIDYLTGLLCDETTIISASHLYSILGDLLISYDVCTNDNDAKEICQKIWEQFVDRKVVAGQKQQPPIIKTESQTATAATTAANVNTKSILNSSSSPSPPPSDAVDEWDLSDMSAFTRIVWRPVFETSRPRLIPGLSVLAKYKQDEQWYPATIESITPEGNFRVFYSEYNEHEVVGIERLKIQEKVSTINSHLLSDQRQLSTDDYDPFEAAFTIKKLSAPIIIGDFGGLSKPSKSKSVQLEERKQLTKKQLKKELKDRKLAALAAKREQLRRERAAKLQAAALQKYLASDKSKKVGDINIDHFSMNTPDGGQELLSNARLRLISGRRYGLIGRNGIGKTTLMRLIANYEIYGFPENIRVVHLEQEVAGNNLTVIDAVIKSDAEREWLLQEELEILSKISVEEAAQIKEQSASIAVENDRSIASERVATYNEGEEDRNNDLDDEEDMNVDELLEEMKELQEIKEDEEDGEEDEEDSINDLDNIESTDVDDTDNTDSSSVASSSSSSSSFRSSIPSTFKKRNTHVSASNTPSSSNTTSTTAVDPLVRLQQIYTRLRAIDAFSAESRARTILSGLQFSLSRQQQLTKDLSGGWRMRVALACALFVAPDLLLLDEPTNHLDFPAVLWLEEYLSRYKKTLIVVSHDRTFLNTVITDVIHFYQHSLHYYHGDYTSFEKVRQSKLIQYKRELEAHAIKRAHIQSFIDKFRYNAKRASLVQSRIKALARMDTLIEIVEEPVLHFVFPQPDPLAGIIIGLANVSFGYHKNNILLQNVNCVVDMESRIGILGANGVGKSTLLHLMLGRFPPTNGQITRNSAARISTFTQHHIDTLDLHLNAIDLFSKLFPNHPVEHYRRHLGGFGITGDLALQEILNLSGGQKSRVAFAVVTWRKPHLIIMDEPTNHLDLETIEALIAAIKAFEGGIVCVSHDIHFLTSIANSFWGVSNKEVKRFDTFEASKKFSYAASNY